MTSQRPPEHELFTGLFDDIPAAGQGRKRALRAAPPPTAWDKAIRFVDHTSADTLIEGWLREDHPNRERRVGAPEKISPRTFLITSFALAFAGLSRSYTAIHHVLVTSVNDELRQMIGLTSDPTHLHYTAIVRAAKKITTAFDPRPYPSRRGLTPEETNAIDASRDRCAMAVKQHRADRLQAVLFHGTYQLLPRKVRRAWKGDLTADGTVIPVFGKQGHRSRRRSTRTARSQEALAGWHAKTQDRRDRANEQDRKPDTEYTFGYDATIAMMTNPAGTSRMPPLVLALTLDTPGRQPGRNLAAALSPLVALGVPTGTLTVDLGFSQLRPENYGLLVKGLGYELMHGIKEHERGAVQAHENGVIALENRMYGPCLPVALRNATLDRQAERIDQATYEQRVAARRNYEMRTKSSSDSSLVLRCPGAGPNRTVNCPLKPVTGAQSRSEAKAGRILPIILDTPADPPPCCTNSESVSVSTLTFAPYVTKHPFNTPEYLDDYRGARNQMEGRNGYLKNPLETNIADAGLRRFRGWGKQYFALLVAVVAANVAAILTALDVDDEPPDPIKRGRGRPAKRGLRDYLPDPTGPPLRIIGPDKPVRTVA